MVELVGTEIEEFLMPRPWVYDMTGLMLRVLIIIDAMAILLLGSLLEIGVFTQEFARVSSLAIASFTCSLVGGVFFVLTILTLPYYIWDFKGLLRFLCLFYIMFTSGFLVAMSILGVHFFTAYADISNGQIALIAAIFLIVVLFSVYISGRTVKSLVR